MVDTCAVLATPRFCVWTRGHCYTFRWLGKRAPLTPWSETLLVTVGEAPGLQQACGRLHKKSVAQKDIHASTCEGQHELLEHGSAWTTLFTCKRWSRCIRMQGCKGVRQNLVADVRSTQGVVCCSCYHIQLLLIKMMHDKMDSVGDQVPSIFIILQSCLAHSLVSFIDPRCQIDHIRSRSPYAQVERLR